MLKNDECLPYKDFSYSFPSFTKIFVIYSIDSIVVCLRKLSRKIVVPGIVVSKYKVGFHQSETQHVPYLACRHWLSFAPQPNL